ncbi:hypothetical protein JOB18_031480, partial [Solea senegalensis]
HPVKVGCRGFNAASTISSREWVSEDRLSEKLSGHCQRLQKVAATDSGTPEKPGVTIELSGGVMGLSVKHHRRKNAHLMTPIK